MGINVGGNVLNLGINPIARVYTGSASWSVPTASNFYGALVVCLGAGGAGGSGRRGANNSTRTGGGGGGGGALVKLFIPSASLTASPYSITIAAGGNSGGATTTDTTNGAVGGTGGSTSFGSLVVAAGGNGGPGGTTSTSNTAGGGGSPINCTPSYLPNSVQGATGGSVISAGTFRPGFPGFSSGATANGAGGGAGGGSGGRLVSTSGSIFPATDGGAIYIPGSLINGPVAPTTSGATGLNGQNHLTGSWHLIYEMASVQVEIGTGGTGGKEGEWNAGTPLFGGGNGGNGAVGAGGGGGGPSTNGSNGGAGGNGGRGVCVVLEIYGLATQ